MNDDEKTSVKDFYTEPLPRDGFNLHRLIRRLNTMLGSASNSPPSHRFEIYQFRGHWSEPQYRVLLVPTERSEREQFHRNLSQTEFSDD